MNRWLDEATARVGQCLGHHLRRPLHVVIYASAKDAVSSLERQVPVTALLAPVHTPACALVALHSPALHPWNQDPARMLRHLCHELGHVYTAEVTGSVKWLGDGNLGMRIEPWIDEGIAECTAAVAAAQPEVIDRALERARRVTLAPEAVNEALCDLNSPERADAFAVATAAVWRCVQRHSLPTVFRQAAEPDSWWVSPGQPLR